MSTRAGRKSSPPLSRDELGRYNAVVYDAVAQNESAVEFRGEAVLAQIARELVSVMQRDTKSDWTVGGDPGILAMRRAGVLTERAVSPVNSAE